MIVLATCARMGLHVWTISTGTPACAHPRTWESCASRMWMSVDSDPVCVRMVPLARTPSVASHASVLMAGQAQTVVSILMTAQVLLASMVPLALIGWAASTAGAHQERQVCRTSAAFCSTRTLFRFHQMREICCIVDKILASQDELCSME
jgi:hypothetical protein